MQQKTMALYSLIVMGTIVAHNTITVPNFPARDIRQGRKVARVRDEVKIKREIAKDSHEKRRVKTT